jgi:hypothetical protein
VLPSLTRTRRAWRISTAALGFQRAIQEASAVADSNHALVARVLPTCTSITAKIASLISLPYYSTTLDAAQIQRVATLMFAGGMLKKNFDVTPILFHPAGGNERLSELRRPAWLSWGPGLFAGGSERIRGWHGAYQGSPTEGSPAKTCFSSEGVVTDVPQMAAGSLPLSAVCSTQSSR